MMTASGAEDDDMVSLGLEEPELVLHPRVPAVEEDQAKNMMVSLALFTYHLSDVVCADMQECRELGR